MNNKAIYQSQLIRKNRTYQFEVAKTKNQDLYFKITETKNGKFKNSPFSVYVFEEDINAFVFQMQNDLQQLSKYKTKGN
jgi:hypothetical protein